MLRNQKVKSPLPEKNESPTLQAAYSGSTKPQNSATLPETELQAEYRIMRSRSSSSVTTKNLSFFEVSDPESKSTVLDIAASHGFFAQAENRERNKALLAGHADNKDNLAVVDNEATDNDELQFQLDM